MTGVGSATAIGHHPPAHRVSSPVRHPTPDTRHPTSGAPMPEPPRANGHERTTAANDVLSAGVELRNPGRPPVVLLHGIGSRGESWRPVIDPLAARFHLYQLDLRGHGASAKPERGYLLEHYA